MKTLQKLTLILLIAFTASCSKDDDSPAADNSAHNNLILKTTDSDDGYVRTYAYDASNRLTALTYGSNPDAMTTLNFTYDASGKLQKATNADSGEVVEYFYDAQNRLVKKTERDGIDLYLYTYSGNQVTENYMFSVTNIGWRSIDTFDSKGNLIESKNYSGVSSSNPEGTFSGNIYYTYNDKISAHRSVPAAFRFPTTNVNDLVSIQYDDAAPGIYTSEYNSDGYPTKKTSGYTTTYEYRRL